MSLIKTQDLPVPAKRHIANISAELQIGSRVIYPAQVSYDQLILAEATDVKAGPARLKVSIDGTVRASDIEILPHPLGTLEIPIRLLS